MQSMLDHKIDVLQAELNEALDLDVSQLVHICHYDCDEIIDCCSSIASAMEYFTSSCICLRIFFPLMIQSGNHNICCTSQGACCCSHAITNSLTSHVL